MNLDAASVSQILTGLLALVFWFSRRTVDQLEAKMTLMEAALQNIRVDYLHKNEFKDFKAELRELFDDLKKDIRDSRNGT